MSKYTNPRRQSLQFNPIIDYDSPSIIQSDNENDSSDMVVEVGSVRSLAGTGSLSTGSATSLYSENHARRSSAPASLENESRSSDTLSHFQSRQPSSRILKQVKLTRPESQCQSSRESEVERIGQSSPTIYRHRLSDHLFASFVEDSEDAVPTTITGTPDQFSKGPSKAGLERLNSQLSDWVAEQDSDSQKSDASPFGEEDDGDDEDEDEYEYEYEIKAVEKEEENQKSDIKIFPKACHDDNYVDDIYAVKGRKANTFQGSTLKNDKSERLDDLFRTHPGGQDIQGRRRSSWAGMPQSNSSEASDLQQETKKRRRTRPTLSAFEAHFRQHRDSIELYQARNLRNVDHSFHHRHVIVPIDGSFVPANDGLTDFFKSTSRDEEKKLDILMS